MLVGVNIEKIWEFANKQQFFINETFPISSMSDFNTIHFNTLIKLDDRYNVLGREFLGPIYFSHIKYVVPITQQATESFEQLCRIFPEVDKFTR